MVENSATIIGRCEHCDDFIYDDNEDVYIDDDNYYYCSLDCLLDHYKITKYENY